MKIPIKKIFLIAAALIFLSAGVSFAHDRNPRPKNYKSRWHDQGTYHKAPAYRPLRYKTNYHVYRHRGYGHRHRYNGHYYPKKIYKRHNYYRHHKGYPSRHTFYFGFSVR